MTAENAASTPEGEQTREPNPAEAKAPKWDGDFDPDRAAKLVANLRAEAEQARNELKQAKAVLDAQAEAEKTELQKLQEARERDAQELLETRSQLLRMKVQREHNLPDELADFLTGDDEEAMKAKATRLAAFAKTPADDMPHRPNPALQPTPGHGGPSPEPEWDPDKAAAAIRADLDML